MVGSFLCLYGSLSRKETKVKSKNAKIKRASAGVRPFLNHQIFKSSNSLVVFLVKFHAKSRRSKAAKGVTSGR